MSLVALAPALRFRPHPEVWLLVAAVVGYYVYVVRTIAPVALGASRPGFTPAQKRWAVLAVVVLWGSSDWPMHDVGEQELYLVHMVQHLLLTFVLPPAALLATPAWLARLMLGEPGSRAWRMLRWACRPVQASVVFNALVVATHWPTAVSVSVQYGVLHFAIHLGLVLSAFAVWMSICGPIEEFRISRPAAMITLFLQSIVPTVPASWLILSDSTVYKSYEVTHRLLGITPITDQQLAGITMKLIGAGYLWGLITVMFFRWTRSMERDNPPRFRRVSDVTGSELTYDQVQAAFDSAGPAPHEADVP